MLRVVDCIRDGIRLSIPEPTERQRIGDKIKVAFVLLTRIAAMVNGWVCVRMIRASRCSLMAGPIAP